MRQALSPGLVIEREIGGGSMGAVFLGHDPVLDRDVAIKVLRPEMAGAVGAERFRREARLLAKLRHPHIVPVHQAGEADGLFYFVMELVRGETLQARLTRGPLPPKAALALVHNLLDALNAAHQLGIVHRDVKPANIFLGDQGAMLADFGIAKMEPGPETEPLTDHGPGPGTPGYMAPEQAAGGPALPESDLYAVGMVLYECLTGRRWVASADPARADWSRVPHRVIPALRRALRVDSRQRWRSADAFGRALAPRRGAWLLVGAAFLAAAVVTWRVAPPRVRVEAGDPVGDALIWSPGPALPADSGALRLWRKAEDEYRLGRWLKADTFYTAALARDSTCLICQFRLTDIDRFLIRPRNLPRQAELARRAARFAPWYAGLVLADTAHQLNRLRLLSEVSAHYLDFPLGRYLYGEELFNRGPLYGHDRREAIEQLDQATRLDSAFAPPWFDLLLARIAEGDSAGAVAARERLDRFGPAEGLAELQRKLAQAAFAARFNGTPDSSVRAALADSALARLPLKNAGPRLLPGLGSPAGGVEVGRVFEEIQGDPIAKRSGLVAQMVGHAATGRLRAMRQAAARLEAATNGTPEWRVFGAQLDAALVLAEAEPQPQALLSARDRLSPFLLEGYPAAVRRSAGWMLDLLAARRGVPEEQEPFPQSAEAPDSPLRTLMRAVRLRPAEALRATHLLDTDLETWDREADPFMRALFKLLRAGWMERIGNTDAARSAYRWHEHFNLSTPPTDVPLPSDGDWALATIAYWRQARLLGAPGQAEPELCQAYQEVARRWAGGEEPYAARADTARVQFQKLGCRSRP